MSRGTAYSLYEYILAHNSCNWNDRMLLLVQLHLIILNTWCTYKGWTTHLTSYINCNGAGYFILFPHQLSSEAGELPGELSSILHVIGQIFPSHQKVWVRSKSLLDSGRGRLVDMIWLINVKVLVVYCLCLSYYVYLICHFGVVFFTALLFQAGFLVVEGAEKMYGSQFVNTMTY